jgi:UDP-N-acetylmuramyl pentapeptide synthase
VVVGQGAPFGWEDERSLGAQGERFILRHPQGRLPVSLRLRGAHQVRNAALAGTLALLAGFDPDRVAQGLASVEPEPGRGRLHALDRGGWLLDESYNASPDSIRACAGALLELQGGESVAVLGCIRELGPQSEALHRETGAMLRNLGIGRVWVYGDQAQSLAQGFGPGCRAFPGFEDLRDSAEGLTAVPPGSRILVKGSRFWASERVVAWLLERFATDRPGHP